MTILGLTFAAGLAILGTQEYSDISTYSPLTPSTTDVSRAEFTANVTFAVLYLLLWVIGLVVLAKLPKSRPPSLTDEDLQGEPFQKYAKELFRIFAVTEAGLTVRCALLLLGVGSVGNLVELTLRLQPEHLHLSPNCRRICSSRLLLPARRADSRLHDNGLRLSLCPGSWNQLRPG